MTRRTACRLLLLLCSAVVLLGLLSSATAILWTGGWDQEEFRLTFLDKDGRPVEGVELSVENGAGVNFYHFPVTDYLPSGAPTSDADGVCVFHHAPHNLFGGKEWRLFFVIPMGVRTAPAYVCRFLLHGREVHRVEYNKMVYEARLKDLAGEARKTVKRRWKWLTGPELQGEVLRGVAFEEAYGEMDSPSGRLRTFDLNGDGKIDREEAYAAGASEAACERAWEILSGRRPEWEELEFLLVERVVVIDE